jgi:hypothetical protein
MKNLLMAIVKIDLVQCKCDLRATFNSGSSSPKVAEFCLTLRLVYVIARLQAFICALSSVYSLPCDNFVQKVVPRLLRTSIYPWFIKSQLFSTGSYLTRPWERAFTSDSQGLHLHSVTTLVDLQRGIYSFLLPLS